MARPLLPFRGYETAASGASKTPPATPTSIDDPSKLRRSPLLRRQPVAVVLQRLRTRPDAARDRGSEPPPAGAATRGGPGKPSCATPWAGRSHGVRERVVYRKRLASNLLGGSLPPP